MFDFQRKYIFVLDLSPFNYLYPFDYDMYFDIAKTVSWALALVYYIFTPFIDSLYDNNFNNSRYCCSYDGISQSCTSYKYLWFIENTTTT